MYLIFLKDKPNSLKSLSAILINFLGVIDLIFFLILLSIELAASIDICCPITILKNVWKVVYLQVKNVSFF